MSHTSEAAQLGDLLQAEIATDRFAYVSASTLSPRNAAAKTLAAYLKRVLFRIGGGDDGQPVEFHLNEVREEWPESFEGLDFPLAAITSVQHPISPHSLTPTMLEDTCDKFCPGTVLWKTGELAIEFQVDFWTNDKPTREAIDARLPDAFNPTEGRAGILVQGPDEYFALPVRFQLLGTEGPDDSKSVYDRVRELRARVFADLDVVHLRQAVPLRPQIGVDGEPINLKELEPTPGA